MALLVAPGVANAATQPHSAITSNQAADSQSLWVALCDADGPCLNMTNPVDGGAVTMFTYGSTDSYESIDYELSDVYGCEHVTDTCPFKATDFDSGFWGDPVITINSTVWGGCIDAYPSTDLEYNSCTKDRSVWVLDGNTLYSPYWTNQYGQAYVLYGPPLGDQAYVWSSEGLTREEWTARALS